MSPNPPQRTPVPVIPSPEAADDATEPPVIDRRSSEAGQATAEYALVLLGAAAVAVMLAAWAAKTGAISELFDAIVGQLLDKTR